MAKAARTLLQIAKGAKKVPRNLWLRLSGTFVLRIDSIRILRQSWDE